MQRGADDDFPRKCTHAAHIRLQLLSVLLVASSLNVADAVSPSVARFPWKRTPLKASPGIGRPEVVEGNRSSGVLTDAEIRWLAATHDIIILSGATQDPTNTTTCGAVIVNTAAKIRCFPNVCVLLVLLGKPQVYHKECFPVFTILGAASSG